MQLTALSLALSRIMGGGAWSPLSLFAAGEQGAWYQPSDLTTLYQDAAGTIPVTAVEQPVGLMLDKSTGGAQVEVITNAADRNFTSNTGYWTLEAGITISGGALNFSNAGSSNACYKTSGVVAGNWYVATVTVVSVTSGAVKLNLGSTFSSVISTPGTYTFKFRAGGAGMGVYSNTAVTTATISYISYQQLPGNHAFQATAGNRPTLSARVNLLTYSEDFTNGAWVKPGGGAGAAITANSTNSPVGTLTADTYTCVAGTNAHWIYQSPSPAPTSSASYKISICVKPNTVTWFAIGQGYTTGWTYFNLTGSGSLGTVDSSYGATASITQHPSDSSWYICTVTYTSLPGGGFAILACTANNSLITFNAAGTESVYIWGADLRPTNIGNNLPSYQRIAAATDYDTAGFPLYLKANGSSSAMATNSIDFTGTDKMTVVTGVRKLSDSTAGMLFELSAIATNPGSFGLQAPNSLTNSYRAESSGSAQILVNATGFSAPISAVLTDVMSISTPVLTLRVNGAQAATSSATQGTGNYGNYPLYLFARFGSSLWFNGQFYGAIIRGATTSGTDLTNAESYMNTQSGGLY